MTIEQAIQKAIEGGYTRNSHKDCDWGNKDHDFLDPSFWQNLFKERGHEMAVKLVDSLFHGETIEHFFDKIEM